MGNGAALRVALDLLHVPWRVRLLRKEPLPEGVPLLLRIAAGDGDAEQEAVATADRPLDVIRQAAGFFIEQILLAPDADSYRVLGASPEVSDSELRRNMASLMTWLHPDIAKQSERSVFSRRIAMAWNDLKTPGRRAAYDRARGAVNARGEKAKEYARSRSTSSERGKKISRAARAHAWGSTGPFERPTGGRLRRALEYLLFGRNFRGRRF